MTSAEVTPAGLILSGTLDIRHRLCRLIGSIEEARSSADRGTRAVLGTLVNECRNALNNNANAVRNQIVAARSAAQTGDPSQWTFSALEEIVNRTVMGFTSLATRHHEVYPQLDGSNSLREDLRYLLFRALNLSLVSFRDEQLVSLKASGNLQWETLAFQTAEGWTASVAVPWLESLAPMRWPLVVHEVAHYFLPFGTETNEIISRASEEHGWSSDAFEEILADAVAQRHFGAAYSFALAREGYLYSYQKHVTGGLSVEQRLNVLAEPNDLLAALPSQWGLSQRVGIDGAEMDAIDDAAVWDMRQFAQEVLNDINSANGWSATMNRADPVSRARALMSRSEPVPGVLAIDANAQIDAAVAKREADPSADVRDVVDAVVHSPLSDAEIFEAAWREEIGRDIGELVEHLAKPVTDDSIEVEIAEVTRRDIWLARSLQSASVHRWLIDTMGLAQI